MTLLATGAPIHGVLMPPSAHTNQLNDAKITLQSLTTSRVYKALARYDGGFTFPDVEQGEYILEAWMPKWTFEPVRVTVHPEEHKNNPASQLVTAKLMRTDEDIKADPIMIESGFQPTFFIEAKGFDYVSLLKSPMVIMLIISGLMMVAMPMMVNSMSPEELAEFRKMQGEGGIMGMLKNIQKQQEELQRGTQQRQQPQQVEHRS